MAKKRSNKNLYSKPVIEIYGSLKRNTKNNGPNGEDVPMGSHF